MAWVIHHLDNKFGFTSSIGDGDGDEGGGSWWLGVRKNREKKSYLFSLSRSLHSGNSKKTFHKSIFLQNPVDFCIMAHLTLRSS